MYPKHHIMFFFKTLFSMTTQFKKEIKKEMNYSLQESFINNTCL